MDFITLLNRLNSDGVFQAIAANPFAQFGTPQRSYVGAEILPERFTNENSYTESLIRYRTVVANDSPRFSPIIKKGGLGYVGEMKVETGTQTIAVELNGRELDAVIQQVNRGQVASVAEFISRWSDLHVNRALLEKTELQRFQALVNASVVRVGANGYGETIAYTNPAGHRVAAGGDWTDDAYDPMDDIVAQTQLLKSKGYNVTRILTSSAVVSTLTRNAKVAARTATLQVTGAGTLAVSGGFASVNSVNQMLQSNGLPIIEVYDAVTRNEAGDIIRFLDEDVMLFVSDAGLDPAEFRYEDETRVVSFPLGYTAIGRVAGQMDAGRFISAEGKAGYPPRIEFEGAQESLPVILEPEAIAVINSITLA